MAEERILQAAAIPVRYNEKGALQVLLINTRGKRKWGIPKGIVEPDQTPAEAARAESLEEAGISGTLSDHPVASFAYKKWGTTCCVSVFLLWVTREHATWAEDAVRFRQWFDLPDAAVLPAREPIIDLIVHLPELIDTTRPSS